MNCVWFSFLALLVFTACGGSSGGVDVPNQDVPVTDVPLGDVAVDGSDVLTDAPITDLGGDLVGDLPTDVPDVGPDVITYTYTYYKDVKKIIEDRCVECHSANGIGPFPLETFEEVKVVAPIIKYAVQQGTMPPWMASPDCRDYKYSRALSEEELEILVTWVDDGAPEGDPSKFTPAEDQEQVNAGPPDLEWDAGVDYVADPSAPDDYHCLVMDQTVSDDIFMTGWNIAPGQSDLVHHVLIYRVPGSLNQALQDKDDAYPGPGYKCGATPEVGYFELLGTWVPGSPVALLPTDSGMLLEKGSKIVLQMHYNTSSVGPGQTPAGDRSTLQLWTRPLLPTPTKIATFVLLNNGDIEIPPGDSAYETSAVFPVGSSVFAGFLPHMHLFGTKFEAVLTRSDGEEECIMDIQDWQFEWQQFYFFEDGHYATTDVGDEITIRCTYDNSASNQPIVNGTAGEPQLVTIGEGTFDEMCLGFLLNLTDCPGAVCETLPACVEGCAVGDIPCWVQCIEQSEGCNDCVLPTLNKCGMANCPADFAAYQVCLGCAEPPCACEAEFQSYFSCLDPVARAGTCNADLACCGAFW